MSNSTPLPGRSAEPGSATGEARFCGSKEAMIMAIVRGGRTTYGESIGILMLDTRFPRIPGDVGNATTFDFPVRFKVVRGASQRRIILEGDLSLLQPFVDGARELEAEGVRAITTSCGFLAL